MILAGIDCKKGYRIVGSFSLKGSELQKIGLISLENGQHLLVLSIPTSRWISENSVRFMKKEDGIVSKYWKSNFNLNPETCSLVGSIRRKGEEARAALEGTCRVASVSRNLTVTQRVDEILV